MASPTASSDPDFLSLAAFTFLELSGSLGRIGESFLALKEGKQPPLVSGRGDPGKRATGKKGARKSRPRLPTSYNLFMSKAVTQLHEEGFQSSEPRGLFKKAVDMWTSKTQGEKDSWTEAHRDELEAFIAKARAGQAPDAELTPEEAAQANEPASPDANANANEAEPEPSQLAAGAAEKQQKKKKRKHQDSTEEPSNIITESAEKPKKKKKKAKEGNLSALADN